MKNSLCLNKNKFKKKLIFEMDAIRILFCEAIVLMEEKAHDHIKLVFDSNKLLIPNKPFLEVLMITASFPDKYKSIYII